MNIDKQLIKINDILNEYKDIFDVTKIIEERKQLNEFYFSGNKEFDSYIIYLSKKYNKSFSNCDFNNIRSRKKLFEHFNNFLLNEGLNIISKHCSDERVKKCIKQMIN